MGTEAVWVPYVIAALGAGAGAVNARQVAKKNEQIQNRGIAAQAARQRDADARLAAATAEQARSTPEAERAQSLDDFTSQLRAAKTAASGTTDVPMGSDRYQTDDTAAKADIQNYGGQLADITSRLVAPMRQRQREREQLGRAESDVAGISRNAMGDAWLTQLMQSSVQPNTALSIAGPMLTGAAGAMAGGAGSTPTSAEFARLHAPSQQAVGSMFRGARRLPITI